MELIMKYLKRWKGYSLYIIFVELSDERKEVKIELKLSNIDNTNASSNLNAGGWAEAGAFYRWSMGNYSHNEFDSSPSAP